MAAAKRGDMKRPAVFFDRDNTLIATDGYLGDPSAVVLVPGAAEAVARVRALGYSAVIFSNQSGVARGMFTEEAVHAVNAKVDELLLDHNPAAVIDRHEFCPFHPEAVVERYRQESDLRKPKPGMIFQAAEKLALDLSRSWGRERPRAAAPSCSKTRACPLHPRPTSRPRSSRISWRRR
jgi:D-glycero-D-manno-heptose 1,7-bisphosphate phosphatase